MQRIINYEKGTLRIGYCDNLRDVSVYENGEFNEPIRFNILTKFYQK